MKKKLIKNACAVALSAALMVGGAAALSSCGTADVNKTEEGKNVDMTSFSLDKVTLNDDYCVNATKKEVDYLLKLDSDRLLAGFYKNAGIESDAEPYSGGWEDALIGGHTLGHYLTAISQAYKSADVSESDRSAIKEKLDYIIKQLKTCQEKSRGEKGFIWGGKIVSEMLGVEAQFDYVEEGKTNISTQAWVPWYTMHKILAGLISAYELADNSTALDIAKNLGDWVYNRVSGWNDSVRSTVLSIEYGGMNDCLYELYNLTGKEEYAVAAHVFDEDTLFAQVKSSKVENVLNNKHANTTIPKFLGALNRYAVCEGKTIGGEKVDASAYLEYVEAFWDMVTTRHTYITGDCSEWEHFGADYVLDSERTNCNCETCCSYNMLKMSRLLFQLTGKVKYLNYYENAFVNTILSSQNPETGMSTYFQPMATGYFKVYSTEETNFWCCTGSGMESFTKLNDSIYYKSEKTLYVGLYLSSTVEWEEQGITLTQTSDLYDGGDNISFTVDKSANKTVSLSFRIPDWAAGDLKITVNGSAVNYSAEEGFAVVEQAFAAGDVISVDIPKKVEAHSLSDGADDGEVVYNDTYAFTYGPLVLSAEMGTENMKTTTTGVNVTIPAKKTGSENIGITSVKSVAEYMENINDYLVKEEGDELKFKMTGTDQDYIFSIHYKQYSQRYGIYFKYSVGEIVDPNTYNYAVETIDTVQPGYGQYENDELHNMTEQDSVGVTNDGTYRYAKAGGYFTYNMKINPDKPNYLTFTLRKEDTGKGLSITVGNTVVYAKTLTYAGPDDEYSVTVRIPDEAIKASVSDNSTVPVKFESYTSPAISFASDSAKVCSFIYMQNFNITYTPDSNVYYFVDCGDYNVNSCSAGDSFGMYNSVTEQVYGEDLVTGKYWGITDDVSNENTQNCANGIGTAWSWAYEYNDGDGVEKTSSNRYTKNQYENGIARHLDYAFELEDGEYTVEVVYSNPWNCSSKQTLTAYFGEANEQVLEANKTIASVGTTTVTAKVTVSGGKLTLHFTSDDLCINVCYIKISK